MPLAQLRPRGAAAEDMAQMKAMMENMMAHVAELSSSISGLQADVEEVKSHKNIPPVATPNVLPVSITAAPARIPEPLAPPAGQLVAAGSDQHHGADRRKPRDGRPKPYVTENEA